MNEIAKLKLIGVPDIDDEEKLVSYLNKIGDARQMYTASEKIAVKDDVKTAEINIFLSNMEKAIHIHYPDTVQSISYVLIFGIAVGMYGLDWVKEFNDSARTEFGILSDAEIDEQIAHANEILESRKSAPVTLESLLSAMEKVAEVRAKAMELNKASRPEPKSSALNSTAEPSYGLNSTDHLAQQLEAQDEEDYNL